MSLMIKYNLIHVAVCSDQFTVKWAKCTVSLTSKAIIFITNFNNKKNLAPVS